MSIFSFRKKTFGFTFIELLVVLGLMGLITIVAYPFLNSTVGRTQLQTSLWELEDTLHRAQSQSQAGRSGNIWGVHFNLTSYVLFKGNTFSLTDPDNVEFTLPASVTIQSVTVNGGGNDIQFDSGSGTTSHYGTVTLFDSSTNSSADVVITRQGKIES